MQKKPTAIVLIALLFIFGYYTWEYFSNKHKRAETHEKEIGGKEEEEEKDRIDLAILQEIKRTKDPNTNSVPVQRLIQAKAFRNQKLAQLKNNRLTNAVPAINWSERGPSNVGGRSRVVWYDLNDAANSYKKVWAGSVGGGLWYTNDITAGSPVWNKVNDLFDNIAITSFVQSTTSPNTMYFGTGEGWFNYDAIRGLGIWKSTDGGVNWTQLPSTLNFVYVQDLIIDQYGNLYASVRNRSGVLTQARGVQKSTDGGVTWTQVLGVPLAGYTSDMGCDLELAANGDIYASLNRLDGRIYRSSFATNGVNTGNAGTWADITPNPTTNAIPAAGDNYDRIEIATAPSNANVVYAIFEGNGTLDVSNIKQYDASTNTWTSRVVPNYSLGGPYTRDQAWYDLIATVDPNNANTLYIGGIDVYKSTNNGANWTRVSDWRSIGLPYVHADIHQISYAPGSSSRIAIGCDGGIFYSSDANVASPNFSDKNSGYNVTQFYSTAIHPTLTNYFLAGAQDNGTQKFTSAGINNTTEATGGDGGFCHIDQDNPNIQITAYYNNNYDYSINGGTTFSTLYSDPDPNGSGDFINPTDYDNTANVLYACSSKDMDPGPTFNPEYNYYTRITGVGTTNTASLVTLSNSSTSALITHVAVSPSVANRVYFGFDNGTLGYVSNANTGATNSVTFLAPTGVTGTVSCIAVDPSDENHILVTYTNYGVNSIWETSNAGTSWTSVEGNLPDMPVRWAMFDPRNPDWAIIATELGVWSTDNLNGGSTDWDPTNSGLANVRVDMLQYRSSDRTIAAATHGRGLFTATVPIVTTPDISFVTSSASATETTTTTNGCRGYTDYTVNMQIANAPTGDATVTVAIQGATAVQGIDFDFTTNGNFALPSNSFVFTNGSTASKPITLRIYDDADIEPSEIFTLTYMISGTTNAQPGTTNQTFTFTINDNDSAPVGPYSQNIWTENWDGTVTGWSTQQAASGNRNNWVVASGCNVDITGYTAQVIRIQGGNNCGYGTYGNTVVMYKQVDATNYSNVQVQFNWKAGGDGTTNYGRLVYSTNSGSSWQNAGGPYFNQATTQSAIVNLPVALNNTTFLLGWSFTSGTTGGSQANSFGIDDIVVSGTRPGTSIETVLNSSKSVYLGPNSDVYFYSAADGELLARIQNPTSHDYGCTSIQIDRAGTGASQFWNTTPANYLMNKTFRVIPTNNNLSGQYTITLYLTQAEVNGWQSATGQLWSNIQLIKLPGPINSVTPSTPEPDGVGTVQVVTPTLGTLGSNYTITYPFSNGFSGFGAGIPGTLGTLPITLLSFTGKLEGEYAKLNWSTSTEQNSKGFEIEKSIDGINYHRIGFVAGAGNSNITRKYAFIDPQRAVEYNYYRLKLVDINNTSKYSEVVLIKNSFGKQDVYIAGNPIRDKLNIQFAKAPNGKVAVSIYDMKGSRVYEASYNNYTQTTLQINTNKFLSHGVYSIKVKVGGNIYSLKAIK